MGGDFEVTNGDITLRVEGLSKTLRALSAAGAASEEMRDLMHSLGMVVVNAAVPKAPVKSGRLADSVRAGKGKTKAVVRAGGARVPYAGRVHYGDPHAGGIAPHEFLVDALRATRNSIFSELDQGIADLLRKNQLM